MLKRGRAGDAFRADLGVIAGMFKFFIEAERSPATSLRKLGGNLFIDSLRANVEDMMYYTTKFHFQANQIVSQMSDSPKKQEQKQDMKCIKQDGISI